LKQNLFHHFFLLVSGKTFLAAEKIRLNPVAEVQPFLLPLFSSQKPGNLNKDEQRYTFYRTAVVWSAD
jgi:hypothetical protein